MKNKLLIILMSFLFAFTIYRLMSGSEYLSVNYALRVLSTIDYDFDSLAKTFQAMISAFEAFFRNFTYSFDFWSFIGNLLAVLHTPIVLAFGLLVDLFQLLYTVVTALLMLLGVI